GVLVGAFFVNEGLPKKQLAATQSVCQFMVHLIKVAVYFSVGFTMAPHLEMFSIIVLMTIAGNYFGTRVLEKIPEKAFYTMLRIVIVLLTARMMIGGIATLMD